MRRELIALNLYETNDDPIELNDYSSGSHAVYLRANPSKSRFVYYKTDEETKEEPRCDYILFAPDRTDVATRFIELKGDDYRRQKRCCSTEWDHGFHQLLVTFEKYREYLQTSERVLFVLSVAIEKKRIAARFKQYKRYKELLNMLMLTIEDAVPEWIAVLYKDEYDELDCE